MSTLELRGSRNSGHTTLSRRHHDLSGTDYAYIGSLPDESANALRHGGSIQVRLREEAGPNEAPWVLEVIREGQTLPGTRLSDDRLAILTAERDRIPVKIEGGELAHRKRALMRTREELAGAETRVTDLKAKVLGMEQEIREMTGLSEENRLTTADGKYELSWQTDGPGRVKRHEEPWRELGPGSLPIRLAEELSDLRGRITAAGGDPLEPGEPPAHYGPDRDLLRLNLPGGWELVQDAQGHVSAKVGNVKVSGLAGDKLTLALAYEVEGARAALSALSPDPAGPDVSDDTPSP